MSVLGLDTSCQGESRHGHGLEYQEYNLEVSNCLLTSTHQLLSVDPPTNSSANGLKLVMLVPLAIHVSRSRPIFCL